MKFLLPVLAAGILISCASAPFHRVDESLGRGGYGESAEALEKNRRRLYGPGDAVLYYLDKGLLTHYAGSYEESSGLLETGERAMEEAFAKSIIQEAGTYLLNDTTRDYGGEDYEDIYTNSFNALNYYHRGDMEEALVEIRRMNNKIRNLADKYGAAATNLQKKALEESLPIPRSEGPSAFNDSALARYLGMLFYRGAGYGDDARIDGDYLRLAFANSPSLYPHSPPLSLDEELEIPPGMARLNLLAFAGLSPVKRANTIRLPIGEGHWVKLALPELVYRPSAVSRIEAVIDGGGRRFTLELLEDIQAVAGETYKAREGIIYLKTIIRASLKGAGSAALDAMAEEVDGNASLVFGLLSLGAQIFADASEQADLRISRYFPAQAYVGGVTLPPGRYSFDVIYYNHAGKAVGSFRYEDVPVLANRLNLTEVICLK
jgi:hypothetical protein